MIEPATTTRFEGKVYKLGDDVSTDLIYPAKFLTIRDPFEMASHVFEGIDSEWPKFIEEYRFIVAGRNFGCGSSREQAVMSLKYSGVKGVIARSFSRIFFRNAINLGFLVIESNEVVSKLAEGEMIRIDLQTSIVETTNQRLWFAKFPPFILNIFNTGGLIEYTKRKLQASQL